MPATQAATRAPSMPPFSTAKFQPMYSPTRTMPTPRPQMCSGPRTRARRTWRSPPASPGAGPTEGAVVSAMSAPRLVEFDVVDVDARQQVVLGVLARDLDRVVDHPRHQHG